MSADNYAVIRKTHEGQFMVGVGSTSDEWNLVQENPVPYDTLEDALIVAVNMETEYGVTMFVTPKA